MWTTDASAVCSSHSASEIRLKARGGHCSLLYRALFPFFSFPIRFTVSSTPLNSIHAIFRHPRVSTGHGRALTRDERKEISPIMGLFTVSIVSMKWCQIISVVWDPITVQHLTYDGHAHSAAILYQQSASSCLKACMYDHKAA